MTRVGPRLALAVLFAFVAAGSLGGTACAAACPCASPRPIAEYAGDRGTAIVPGRVTVLGPERLRGTFHVERWYQGSSAVPDLPIQGGGPADCGLELTTGDHVVLVAAIIDGVLHPSTCAPWGDLDTPEGQRLANEIIATYGAGSSPPGGGDRPVGGIPDDVWLALGIGIVLGFASIVAFARRDRSA